jgi:dihydrofolate synthase / folylpolyglutamate synthase
LYIKNICCPLSGDYQKQNILTVVESCRRLRKSGMSLRKKHIRRGIRNVIKNTAIMGRWDVVSKSPRVICDVAHNNAGLNMVFRQLDTLKFSKLHVIMGVNNDKNLNELFDILPSDARYYFCSASIPRAMDAKEIAKVAESRGYEFVVHSSVTAAFKDAMDQADPETDIIFAGGSTFVVAEIPLLKSKYLKNGSNKD